LALPEAPGTLGQNLAQAGGELLEVDRAALLRIPAREPPVEGVRELGGGEGAILAGIGRREEGRPDRVRGARPTCIPGIPLLDRERLAQPLEEPILRDRPDLLGVENDEPGIEQVPELLPRQELVSVRVPGREHALCERAAAEPTAAESTATETEEAARPLGSIGSRLP